jgi:hypothetical protein
MPLNAANPPDGDHDSAPCQVVPACPICDGRMEEVYDRFHQKVCVCIDCHTGITVPGTAWEVARIKREAKRGPKA